MNEQHQLGEQIANDLDLNKYDLSNEEDWKLVYKLLLEGKAVEQANDKIVDVFDTKDVKGYHGTSSENLQGIFANGILSREEYEKNLEVQKLQNGPSKEQI